MVKVAKSLLPSQRACLTAEYHISKARLGSHPYNIDLLMAIPFPNDAEDMDWNKLRFQKLEQIIASLWLFFLFFYGSFWFQSTIRPAQARYSISHLLFYLFFEITTIFFVNDLLITLGLTKIRNMAIYLHSFEAKLKCLKKIYRQRIMNQPQVDYLSQSNGEYSISSQEWESKIKIIQVGLDDSDINLTNKIILVQIIASILLCVAIIYFLLPIGEKIQNLIIPSKKLKIFYMRNQLEAGLSSHNLAYSERKFIFTQVVIYLLKRRFHLQHKIWLTRAQTLQRLKDSQTVLKSKKY